MNTRRYTTICYLQDDSSYLTLWSKVLSQLSKWELFDKNMGKNITNTYHFVKG